MDEYGAKFVGSVAEKPLFDIPLLVGVLRNTVANTCKYHQIPTICLQNLASESNS